MRLTAQRYTFIEHVDTFNRIFGWTDGRTGRVGGTEGEFDDLTDLPVISSSFGSTTPPIRALIDLGVRNPRVIRAAHVTDTKEPYDERYLQG